MKPPGPGGPCDPGCPPGNPPLAEFGADPGPLGPPGKYCCCCGGGPPPYEFGGPG